MEDTQIGPDRRASFRLSRRQFAAELSGCLLSNLLPSPGFPSGSSNVNTRGWRSAPKRVGIDNFRWHGLRHIRANWRVQNGTPLSLFQEMGGGKPAEMVQQAKVVGDILRDTHSSQGRKITEPIDVKKGLQQS